VQALSGGHPRSWATGAAEHVARSAPELPAAQPQWFFGEGADAGRNACDSACELSTALARRVGLPEAVRTGHDKVYERWDGRGPAAVAGEALCIAARISHLADVVEIAHRGGGMPAVRELVRQRTGSHFDPAVVIAFERCAEDVLDGLDGIDMLQAALDCEPTPRPRRERSGWSSSPARSPTSPAGAGGWSSSPARSPTSPAGAGGWWWLGRFGRARGAGERRSSRKGWACVCGAPLVAPVDGSVE
jgi:hypothetical protein